MTKKEIRDKIRGKKQEIRTVQKKAMCSQDVTEVRSLGETLDKLAKELDDLEDKLSDEDDPDEGHPVDSGNPTDTEGRSFSPMAAYGTRSFTIGSGDMNVASSAPGDQYGGLALRSGETFVSRLPQGERQQSLDLGNYIRGAVFGNWEGAENERRAMNTTAGGILIPAVLSAEVMDTSRNISLFLGSGVSTIPMPSGNMTVARVTKDPSFKFYAELSEASPSEMELGSIELKAKTARGFCYVSKELLMSAQNLSSVLTRAFGGAIAEMIDKAFLYGQKSGSNADDFAPAGIMNDGAINTLTASADGVKNYADIIKAIGCIRGKNGMPNTFAINSQTEELFNLFTDTTGQQLNVPNVVAGLNQIVTNQLSYDATAGSDALVYDNTALVVGIQNNIGIRMLDTTDYSVKHNATCFEVTAYLDCVAVRPDHIVKVTGIKPVTE